VGTSIVVARHWNTHLKKQMRRMVLAKPPPGPTAGSPAARHMAEWETARLEAEARLSLLAAASSSSHGAATTTSASSSSTGDAAGDAPADIYLRLWRSDIGDSFRKAAASVKKSSDAVADIKQELGMFVSRYGVYSMFPHLDVLTEAPLPTQRGR
jgi:transcription factor MYB, plant